MKYGCVNDMTVMSNGILARVRVDFLIDRQVLYEFMDCLMPVNEEAKREPIVAILDHSSQEVDE